MAQPELDGLRARLHGALVDRGHPDHDLRRRVWNGIADAHPAAIVRVADAEDVRSALAEARRLGLPVAVRGGGHSVAGHGTVQDGLVIALGELRAVAENLHGTSVTAGGGATWGDVDAVTQRYGRAVPGGVFSRTGIGGLALGGGLGWIRNAYGPSCASITGAEMVLADGSVVDVDEEHEPDLLWAIRGGGGGFGVVTRFRFETHPVGPEVAFTFVFHDGRDGCAATGLRRFRDVCADLPDSVSALAFVGVVPASEEGFPPGTAGVPFIGFGAMAVGDPAPGAEAMAPLRYLGEETGRGPLLDASATMPYVDAQRVFDDEYPDGARYYWKSIAVHALDDEVIDAVVAAGSAPESELSTVDVWHLAGAARRAGPGAFRPPDGAFLVNPEANWSAPADDARNIAWARRLVGVLTPHSSGSRYLNFAGFQEEGAELTRTALGPSAERLAAIKARVDPDDVFRLALPVRPA